MTDNLLRTPLHRELEAGALLLTQCKVSSKLRTSRRRKEKQRMVHSVDSALLAIVIEPDFEDAPLTIINKETPVYFQSPWQLLEVFSALEAEHLFLIQNI